MADNEDEMVLVPKALLEAVLQCALSDSYAAQGEFSCGREDDLWFQDSQMKIERLMRAAGIDASADAIGQGFFGIAASLRKAE